jgi:hypothetical protein
MLGMPSHRQPSGVPWKEDSLNLVNDKNGLTEASRRSPIDTVESVRQWTHGFRPEAEVLEIGFESGAIPQVLIDANLSLYLVEASHTRLGIFRLMFPEVPSVYSGAKGCTFFSRTFDGVLLCGSSRAMLEPKQLAQLARIERLLRAGGRLLIIIPPQNQEAVDFDEGASAKDVYERVLRNSGLDILPGLFDRSGNEYVSAVKHVYAGVPH